MRAWGRWVLARARKELASYYPSYAEFEPLAPGKNYEPRPMRLLEIDNDGVAQLEPLNAGFDAAYLKDPRNPRWIAKPTVAYLWARTVTCKQCRATLPLLKTRWLCKKDRKRVLLAMDLPAAVHGPPACPCLAGRQVACFSRQGQAGAGRRCLRRAERRAAQRRQRGTAARARQAHWSGDHVADRRNLPVLRRDHDHGGYPF